MAEGDKVIVSQMLDTQVEVFVNPAFALVQLRFLTDRRGAAVVNLDMESCVKVMRAMDDGAEAIKSIKSWGPKPKADTWWRRLLGYF